MAAATKIGGRVTMTQFNSDAKEGKAHFDSVVVLGKCNLTPEKNPSMDPPTNLFLCNIYLLVHYMFNIFFSLWSQYLMCINPSSLYLGISVVSTFF